MNVPRHKSAYGALALALDASEVSEDDALASVLKLEKRWSQFDLDWVEADPGELADRILRWEWERSNGSV